MTPYYADDLVTIYHGDCREFDPLPGDVMVTDPPYGLDHRTGFDASWSGSAIANDHNVDARDLVLARWGGRPAIVFGTWKRPRPVQTRAVLIWDKGPASGMGDLSFPWRLSHEEIYVIGEGWAGRRDESVVKGFTVVTWESKGRHHPNAKPVPLMRYLVGRCPVGVIVDPFVGSGSTLVAAKERVAAPSASRSRNATARLPRGGARRKCWGSSDDPRGCRRGRGGAMTRGRPTLSWVGTEPAYPAENRPAVVIPLNWYKDGRAVRDMYRKASGRLSIKVLCPDGEWRLFASVQKVPPGGFPTKVRRERRALVARFEVLNRDGFRCRYCGASAPDVELHVDHVIPVVKGGSDDMDNLVTACQACNLGKSAGSVDAPVDAAS